MIFLWRKIRMPAFVGIWYVCMYVCMCMCGLEFFMCGLAACATVTYDIPVEEDTDACVCGYLVCMYVCMYVYVWVRVMCGLT